MMGQHIIEYLGIWPGYHATHVFSWFDYLKNAILGLVTLPSVSNVLRFTWSMPPVNEFHLVTNQTCPSLHITFHSYCW
jgi:hypothetical protein